MHAWPCGHFPAVSPEQFRSVAVTHAGVIGALGESTLTLNINCPGGHVKRGWLAGSGRRGSPFALMMNEDNIINARDIDFFIANFLCKLVHITKMVK